MRNAWMIYVCESEIADVETISWTEAVKGWEKSGQGVLESDAGERKLRKRSA